ncbi:hypothetical protein OZX61_12770 (plasmid) [Acinetobacter sp. ESL0695]|uniref:hypothetical protein n=1 Tax=Acinetobacter sp. ESL0695 TaxID=2983215 RepID=UPI0023F30637|nr:hypothetical protein [Acinetobacter sp. ESL0695]WEV50215.1 hypothetical protein OZX61_12770 [Acinetobacter sp. ESL0695]
MDLTYLVSERSILYHDCRKTYYRDFHIFNEDKGIYLDNWNIIYDISLESDVLEKSKLLANSAIERLNKIKECLIFKKLNLQYKDNSIESEIDLFLKDHSFESIDHIDEIWLLVNMVKPIGIKYSLIDLPS